MASTRKRIKLILVGISMGLFFLVVGTIYIPTTNRYFCGHFDTMQIRQKIDVLQGRKPMSVAFFGDYPRNCSGPSDMMQHKEDQSVVHEMKVISMSLYGNNPRYTANALRNVKLVKENFPGWVLRMYLEKAENHTYKYPPVKADIIKQLEIGGVQLIYVNLSSFNLQPRMWRFLVVDDVDVDIFIIRDCDSHLTKRDAAVVREWLKNNASFHCIRDHPSHSRFAINAGLWGAHRESFKHIFGNVTFASMMEGYHAGYIQDTLFLQKIWPKVKDVAYCHDSVSCHIWPNSHPFPVKRQGQEHIGAVFDGNGNGRAGDLGILKRTPKNTKCNPP